MPSPVGHALAGLVVSWTADVVTPRSGAEARRLSGTPAPRSWYERAGGGLTLACAVLAAVPDVDLVSPPLHRAYTHSLGATLVVLVAAALFAWRTRRPIMRIALVCAIAYGSHLLLDWMATDHFFPYGIRALWPFDNGWYISGWDVFTQTERRQLFSRRTMGINVPAVIREIVLLAPIAAAAWLVRVKALARLAPEMTSGHEAAK